MDNIAGFSTGARGEMSPDEDPRGEPLDGEPNDDDLYLMDDRNTLAKGEAGHTMTLLPEDFVPSENDVICGRGRRIFMHPGNEKFRLMVSDCLEEYSNTVTKLEKSYILCDIVAQVRANSPHGGFVKKDGKDGRWYEVGDFLAREKTSQAFRDALHDQYKSSNTAKKIRRQAEHTTKVTRRAFSTSQLDSKSMLMDKSKAREGYTDPLLAKLRANKSARSIFDFNGGLGAADGTGSRATFSVSSASMAAANPSSSAGASASATASSRAMAASILARQSCPNLVRSRASTGTILSSSARLGGTASIFNSSGAGGRGGGRNFEWGGLPSTKESSTANFERRAAMEADAGSESASLSGGVNFDWGTTFSPSKASAAPSLLARIREVASPSSTPVVADRTKVNLFSKFTTGALGELTGGAASGRRSTMDLVSPDILNRGESIDTFDFGGEDFNVDMMNDFDNLDESSSSLMFASSLLTSPTTNPPSKAAGGSGDAAPMESPSLDIEAKLLALRRATFESSTGPSNNSSSATTNMINHIIHQQSQSHTSGSFHNSRTCGEPEAMPSSNLLFDMNQDDDAGTDMFDKLVDLVGDVESMVNGNPFEPDPIP